MYFKNTIKIWLLAILAILLLGSCQEEEFLPLSVEENLDLKKEIKSGFSLEEITEQPLNFRLGDWNMVYEETFEGPDPFYCYASKQFPESHSFSKSSNPVFRGNHSGKFDLRYGDRKATSSGIRSEILFSRPSNPDAWYSFAVNFPSDFWQEDRDHEIFTQWHSSGDPTLSFRVHDGRLIFRVGNSSKNWHHYDFGSVPKNQWVDFVFHIIHSKESTGLVEIWRNGTKILTHKGPNRYADEDRLPRWKVGIYKWSWEKGPTNVSRRVTYFDNIRIGNENSNLTEMRPSTDNTKGWGPYIPDVKDFTLIETWIKKEHGKVSNNDKINLYPFGIRNYISLRANLNEQFNGSLDFQLKGTKPHTRTENTFPYLLYGKNNYTSITSFDYGYNGGTPVGQYDLTVTPYASAGLIGKRGNPINLKFSVINSEVEPDDPDNSDFENEVGLVGRWGMDNSSNPFNDDSGNGNNGKIISSSGISIVSGVQGNAARFSGLWGAYAAIPHNSSVNITQQITVSAWIRPVELGNRQIISKNGPDGFELMTYSGGKVDFRINRDSNNATYLVRSTQNYPTDGKTWMHVAATFDGTKSTIYINGVQNSSRTYTPFQIIPNTAELQIGARKGNNRWVGDLDDVRIYNRALSASEIAVLAK
jgi:hypothetical protein